MQTSARLSTPIHLRVWGEGACFTRPEMKGERVSYDVMTPSAARGVLEAILWKREMRWCVTAIDVLKPIRFAQIRRNEVSNVASPQRVIIADDPDERQQRSMRYLVNVDYVIHAVIELTAEARQPQDSIAKYHQSFLRRAGKGQCFSRPYLGTREFAADFSLLQDDIEYPAPISETRELGLLFYDYDYGSKPRKARLFRARLDRGRLVVPPEADLEIRI